MAKGIPVYADPYGGTAACPRLYYTNADGSTYEVTLTSTGAKVRARYVDGHCPPWAPMDTAKPPTKGGKLPARRTWWNLPGTGPSGDEWQKLRVYRTVGTLAGTLYEAHISGRAVWVRVGHYGEVDRYHTDASGMADPAELFPPVVGCVWVRWKP